MKEIESLLRRGLDFYGKGFFEEAIEAWQEVLSKDPSNSAALDYLESAGVEVKLVRQAKELVDQGVRLFAAQDIAGARRAWEEALEINPDEDRAKKFLERIKAPEGAAAKSAVSTAGAEAGRAGSDGDEDLVDKKLLVSLMREKQFEKALDLVEKAKQLRPESEILIRSAELIENHLTLRYSTQLGSFEKTPVLTTDFCDMKGEDFSPAEAFLCSQIDGLSTIDDLLALSPLSDFQTLRFIVERIDNGFINLA